MGPGGLSNSQYLQLIYPLARDAQSPARGPNPAREGLQSGPRKDFQSNF